MPTASGGIYEVRLEQTYFGDPSLTVLHYLQGAETDDQQEDVAGAFDSDLMADFAAAQNTDIEYVNIRVANLTGTLADFNLTPSQADGDVTGAIASGFMCAAFRKNRISKDTRNGSMRLCGLVEENMSGAGFTAAYNTILDTLATSLSANIVGSLSTYAPIILRKPETQQGVYTYNTISSVQNLMRQTTQNSRKTF